MKVVAAILIVQTAYLVWRDWPETKMRWLRWRGDRRYRRAK